MNNIKIIESHEDCSVIGELYFKHQDVISFDPHYDCYGQTTNSIKVKNPILLIDGKQVPTFANTIVTLEITDVDWTYRYGWWDDKTLNFTKRDCHIYVQYELDKIQYTMPDTNNIDVLKGIVGKGWSNENNSDS